MNTIRRLKRELLNLQLKTVSNIFEIMFWIAMIWVILNADVTINIEDETYTNVEEKEETE